VAQVSVVLSEGCTPLPAHDDLTSFQRHVCIFLHVYIFMRLLQSVHKTKRNDASMSQFPNH
jgi:hypothetical protein